MARFEEFWEVACSFRELLRLGFMFMVFLFILTVMALLLAEPGTDAYAISILNFAMVVVFGGIIAYMTRVCSARAGDFE